MLVYAGCEGAGSFAGARCSLAITLYDFAILDTLRLNPPLKISRIKTSQDPTHPTGLHGQ